MSRIISLLTCLLLASGTWAAEPSRDSPDDQPGDANPAPATVAPTIKLELDLIDGSRLLAEPVDAGAAAISVKTRLGSSQIKLCDLARFEMQPDQETIILHWANGDRLTGVAARDGVAVKTVLGKLHIPFASLRQCTVRVVTPTSAPIKPQGVSASGEWTFQVARNAIDGDNQTAWCSGDYGGWIEVDLGSMCEISAVQFELHFSPTGPSTHDIFLADTPMAGDSGKGKQVATLSGTRSDHEIVSAKWPAGTRGRYVMIRCASSVSWFGIKEINVLPK